MYHTLKADDLIVLREERLQALEADLHRARLQAEEDPPSPQERAALDARIAELTRRIAVHLEALTPPMPEGTVVPAERTEDHAASTTG